MVIFYTIILHHNTYILLSYVAFCLSATSSKKGNPVIFCHHEYVSHTRFNCVVIAKPFKYLNYEEDYVSTAYLTTYLDFDIGRLLPSRLRDYRMVGIQCELL